VLGLDADLYLFIACHRSEYRPCLRRSPPTGADSSPYRFPAMPQSSQPTAPGGIDERQESGDQDLGPGQSSRTERLPSLRRFIDSGWSSGGSRLCSLRPTNPRQNRSPLHSPGCDEALIWLAKAAGFSEAPVSKTGDQRAGACALEHALCRAAGALGRLLPTDLPRISHTCQPRWDGPSRESAAATISGGRPGQEARGDSDRADRLRLCAGSSARPG
jgi:hypothetical protein